MPAFTLPSSFQLFQRAGVQQECTPDILTLKPSPTVHHFALKSSCRSQKEPSMNAVQVEQNSYEMPPRDGFIIAHFLTVADIEQSRS
jgi:hypothetical protein